MSSIWAWIAPKLLPIGVIVSFLVVGLIGYQQWTISDLKHDKKELETQVGNLKMDKLFYQSQIAALSTRETENKKIEAKYETLVKELKGKNNGPVADVLRHAIAADVVRP